MKAWLSYSIKLSIAVAIIWFIRDKFVLSDFDALIGKPLLLIIVPVSWAINQLITSMRLHTMLLALGHKIPLSDTLQANFSSLFIGNIMPGVVGADIVKFFFIKKHNDSISNSQLAVVLTLDRFFGLLSVLFWCSVFACVIDKSAYTDDVRTLLIYLPISLLGALCTGFIIFIAALRYSNRFQIPLFFKNIADIFALLINTKRKKLLVAMLFYNLLAVFALLMGLVTVGGYLQESQSGKAMLALQFFLIPVSLVVAMLPLTPMGIGVVQVSMGSAYTMFGLDAHVGISVSTLSQIGQLIVSVLIGGPIFLFGRKRKKALVTLS